MDFPNQLVGFINDLNLPIKMKLGYLDTGESFVMYPLPGSRVIDEFMDGTTDQQLNFEIAKSRIVSSFTFKGAAIRTLPVGG